MKIKVTKDSITLKIDSSCYPAWEKAGWKKCTEEEKAPDTKKAK